MDLYASVKQFWLPLALALACVVAGGLTAAVTAHAATRAASWAAAYLVLVAGVATAGLALGRGLLSPVFPAPGRVGAEFSGWFIGNALVLVGTLSPVSWLVEVGSVLLVISLALIVLGVRSPHPRAGGAQPGPGTVPSASSRGLRTIRTLFLTLVTVLIVSIPIGILLSHLRR